MASAPTRTTGGPGSQAITNDDPWTYVEPDNGWTDFENKTYNKIKDPRSY